MSTTWSDELRSALSEAVSHGGGTITVQTEARRGLGVSALSRMSSELAKSDAVQWRIDPATSEITYSVTEGAS